MVPAAPLGAPLLTRSPAVVQGGAAAWAGELGAADGDGEGASEVALDDDGPAPVAVDGELGPDDAHAAASTGAADRSKPLSTRRARESDDVMVFPCVVTNGLESWPGGTRARPA